MDQKTNVAESEQKLQKDTAMAQAVENVTGTIDELKRELSDRAAEIEELHSLSTELASSYEEKVAALTAKVSELENSLASAMEEKATADKAKVDAEEALKRYLEEAQLKDRLSKLNEYKLLRSDEAKQCAQAEKVKAMSDEEFQSYFEDLMDVRSQSAKEEVVAEDSADDVESEAAEAIVNETAGEKIVDTNEKIRQLLQRIKPTKKGEDASVVENKETASVTVASSDLLAEGFLNILYSKNS